MQSILMILLAALEKNGSFFILQLLGVGCVLVFLLVLAWIAKVKFLSKLDANHKVLLEKSFREELRQEIRTEELPKLRREMSDTNQSATNERDSMLNQHPVFNKLDLVSHLHRTSIKGDVRKGLFVDLMTDYFYLLQANLLGFATENLKQPKKKWEMEMQIVESIQKTNLKIGQIWQDNGVPPIVVVRMLKWLNLRTGVIEMVIQKTISFKTWDKVADILFDLLDLIWTMQHQLILNGAEMFAVLNGELTGQFYKDRVIE